MAALSVRRRLAVLLPALVLAPSLAAAGVQTAGQASPVSTAGDAEGLAAAPLVRVLDDTGKRVEGLRVVATTSPDEVGAALSQGAPLRLLRLYGEVRRWLHRPVRPVRIVLADVERADADQGLRVGERRLPRAGYVVVPSAARRGGGADGLDQAVVVGLSQLLVREVAGAPAERPVTLDPTPGAQTDRDTALRRGLGWALASLAIEDPDALPATRALAADAEGRQRESTRLLGGYREELLARVALAPPLRTTFDWWYPRVARQQRYVASESDGYARAPRIPDRVLTGRSAWSAVLADSVLPGAPDDPPRPAAQLIARPGALAALLRDWLTERSLQSPSVGPAFRAAFGGRPRAPVDNALLRLLFALERSQTFDLPGLVGSYRRAFPGDTDALDRVVRAGLLGQRLPSARPLWVTARSVHVGSSVLTQYPAAGAASFDLNAATVPMLVAATGVSPRVARRVQQGAPYTSVRDVRRIKGVDRLAVTAWAPAAQTAASTAPGPMPGLSWEAGVRIGLALLLTLLAGGLLAWLITGWSWWRSTAAAALVGWPALALAWAGPAAGVIGWSGLPAVGLGGLAAVVTAIALIRHGPRRAARWAVGSAAPVLPVLVIITAW